MDNDEDAWNVTPSGYVDISSGVSVRLSYGRTISPDSFMYYKLYVFLCNRRRKYVYICSRILLRVYFSIISVYKNTPN